MAVALESAAAIGDDECGTEYLLLGVMTAARGDVAELAELFALDPMRVERGIHNMRAHRFSLEHDGPGYPPLSPRARRTLITRRPDGSGPTGPFELLHGMLGDDASGACQVLRELGVRPAEMRRLVAYGTRHLSKDQLDELLDSLDRRSELHRPWWGPAPSERLVTLAFGGNDDPLEIAQSNSAAVSIRSLAVAAQGFGFTMVLDSLRPWLLPPVLRPAEVLVPGQQPTVEVGPDTCSVELIFADGSSVANTTPHERWDNVEPKERILVPIGMRSETVSMNDRRSAEQALVTSDWWVWPLPPSGPVEARVEWSSELVQGSAKFDADPVLYTAIDIADDLVAGRLATEGPSIS